ncbi:uncharacterized protein PAC_15148 [Phialocephala subalpina]|uniref:Uncharacterized protein n=1 Tax=Phialocephala subalpina TaxID=576137 RepID=A0A1L7XJQ9_9HELO|nr:uncharacterized protein PAC_15148 [Phialocephala subalpina]
MDLSPTTRSLTEEDRFSLSQLSPADVTGGLQDNLICFESIVSITLERLLPIFEKSMVYMWAPYHFTIYHHLVGARHALDLLSDINKDIITDDGLRFGADILDHLAFVFTSLLNGLLDSGGIYDLRQAVSEIDTLINENPGKFLRAREYFWKNHGKQMALDVCGLRLLASIGTLPSLESELHKFALLDAIEAQCLSYVKSRQGLVPFLYDIFGSPTLTTGLEKKWLRQRNLGMDRHNVSVEELPAEVQEPPAEAQAAAVTTPTQQLISNGQQLAGENRACDKSDEPATEGDGNFKRIRA